MQHESLDSLLSVIEHMGSFAAELGPRFALADDHIVVITAAITALQHMNGMLERRNEYLSIQLGLLLCRHRTTVASSSSVPTNTPCSVTPLALNDAVASTPVPQRHVADGLTFNRFVSSSDFLYLPLLMGATALHPG